MICCAVFLQQLLGLFVFSSFSHSSWGRFKAVCTERDVLWLTIVVRRLVWQYRTVWRSRRPRGTALTQSRRFNFLGRRKYRRETARTRSAPTVDCTRPAGRLAPAILLRWYIGGQLWCPEWDGMGTEWGRKRCVRRSSSSAAAAAAAARGMSVFARFRLLVLRYGTVYQMMSPLLHPCPPSGASEDLLISLLLQYWLTLLTIGLLWL